MSALIMTVQERRPRHTMPVVERGDADGRWPVGNLPCGTAYMETGRDRALDGTERTWLVWWLDKKVLAVVFVNGQYTAYIDWDFDGYYDVVETGPSPTDRSATDYYALVKGCEGVRGFTYTSPPPGVP